jgi:hypothetical protein
MELDRGADGGCLLRRTLGLGEESALAVGAPGGMNSGGIVLVLSQARWEMLRARCSAGEHDARRDNSRLLPVQY